MKTARGFVHLVILRFLGLGEEALKVLEQMSSSDSLEGRTAVATRRFSKRSKTTIVDRSSDMFVTGVHTTSLVHFVRTCF